jgi:hypothetical protein
MKRGYIDISRSSRYDIYIKFENELILNLQYRESTGWWELENVSGEDDTGLMDLNEKLRLKIIGVDEI